MSDAPSLPHLGDFPSRTFDKLRYGDTDRQGHVNNAVFSTFLETGRTHLLFETPDFPRRDDCSFVIARLELDFLGEILWPGTVEIGSRVASVGRSSVRMEQAVFQNGRCVARGVSTLVQVSNATKRGEPFSPEARAALEALSATAAPVTNGTG